MVETPEKYDGFNVLPDPDTGTICVSFFNLTDEYANGTPIENTKLGDKFQVILYKNIGNFEIRYDEHFEAIFADPVVYMQNLLPNFSGTFFRKTTKSEKMYDDYLTHVVQNAMIEKLKRVSTQIKT